MGHENNIYLNIPIIHCALQNHRSFSQSLSNMSRYHYPHLTGERTEMQRWSWCSGEQRGEVPESALLPGCQTAVPCARQDLPACLTTWLSLYRTLQPKHAAYHRWCFVSNKEVAFQDRLWGSVLPTMLLTQREGRRACRIHIFTGWGLLNQL